MLFLTTIVLCGSFVAAGSAALPATAASPRLAASQACPTGGLQQSQLTLAEDPAFRGKEGRVRVEELFRQLGTSTDRRDNALSRAVLAGEAVWLEEGVIDLSEGTGPWISERRTGPSGRQDVRRRYR